MIWLYILLAIILFVLLFAVVPVSLTVRCHKELKCILKIGFIPITIYPKKVKKKKTKKSKKTEKVKQAKPEQKEEKNLLKEKGLNWFINLIKKIADLVKGVLKDFFKHILIKEFLLSIKVSGEDAADTAIKYGYCCSAVYPAVGLIIGSVRYEKYGVDITPVFDEKAEFEIDFDLYARIFSFHIIGLVFRHGIKGIKLLLNLRELGE